jgi:carboxyl-terminal processing protease
MKFKVGTKFTTLLLFTTLFTGTFGNVDTSSTQQQQSNGFLSNIRELKEMSDIMDLINANFVYDTENKDEINRKSLMQGALKGMIQSLNDPHSNYFSKKEMEDFKEDIKGKYAGVGMVIQKKTDEPLIVVSPIEDTPAYKAGIKPKDKIISIDGESTYNLSSEESAKRLKGEKGSTVKIVVYREATKETKEIPLVRDTIELKYVKSKMLTNDIGYLRLTQFGENVYPDVKSALENLQKDGMKGLVLDLRSNPGGALDQSIKIASMFIKNGAIVSTKGKEGEEQISQREGNYYGNFPMTVLINGGSASASEIVAGAIKDHKRGILVGEKSFGKGSVQTLIPLPDGDGIKLTIAKYYTPSGVSIHGKGIEPDILVEEKDGYMFFDGFVTNVNEEEVKKNKNEIIKTVKGEEEAKKLEEKKDMQLETAQAIVKALLMQQGGN